MTNEIIVEVLRGEIVESRHHVVAVAVTANGRVIRAWGDAGSVTFMRSSAKPFQALPLVESGAADAFGFGLRELALACASHAGTDAHVEVASRMLEKLGLSETALQCGTHYPYDRAATRRLIQAGEPLSPLRNNCSGKHAGMLALSLHLGESIESYLDPGNAVQRRIRETLARMADLAADEILVGVDGCSAPTFALPLRSAALAFARLMSPESLPSSLAMACEHVVEAMQAHPDMVSGPGRFDTRLMEVGAGRILAKGGAEGYQALALRAGALGAGSPAAGLALKVWDGDPSGRARSVAALAILQALGALSKDNLSALEEFGERPLLNLRGKRVGRIRVHPGFQDEIAAPR